MARIVYGVSGEGSGHSSRAREMISHIQKLGHKVKAVSYDRGYRNLKDDFDVFETVGLHISSLDNRVSILKTLTDNIHQLPLGGKKLRALRKEVFKEFRPDCVITDFEPMTAYLATHYKLPLISLDNQHRMRYMEYPCPPKLKKDQLITENVIRAMVPRPDVSLVTTFYFGRQKNERTFFFPPILRREVLTLKPERGRHILVYFTSGFESFLELLKSFDRERFVVYGYNESRKEDHITYKPFSREGFLEDLRTCKAVMATAGFTLMTEAFYLQKPYLALPMRGQFEQELNGFLLGRLSYGSNLAKADAEAIGNFLYRLPDYRKSLQQYQASDNRAIKAKLKELLDDNCALLKAFQQKRKKI